MVEFTGFNEKDYLTTSTFMNLLENVKTGSVCNILPDVIYNNLFLIGNLLRCQILLPIIISRCLGLGIISIIKLHNQLFVNRLID